MLQGRKPAPIFLCNGGDNMEVIPLPKPGKRPPKNKREPNPQKEKWSRVADPDAIEGARRDYCVKCGLSRSDIIYEVHNIRGRTKSDGHDTPENLINLCKGPGSNGCHERAHGIIFNGKGPIPADDLKYFTLEDIAQQK